MPVPNINTKIDHSGEEFIFIIDCSGSMYGNEIKLAAECLVFFIKSLPLNCFFNVVCFGSHFGVLFEKTVQYTNENAKKAIDLAASLEANMGGTVLSSPLSYVFSQPLSKPNELRRIFVLTDGRIFDREVVIDLVKKNNKSTMSNAIGIGYRVDPNLVEGISKAGNGFVDFVFSGDDMRSKVINQLEQSLNGLCHAQVSIENNESIEIVPPIDNIQISFDAPYTFYIKSTKELTDNDLVRIDIKGNSEPIIIQMNSFPEKSNTNKSLRYLFHNENIKYLLRMDQTNEVIKKVANLSIENGILCPYTGLIGIQQFVSEEEENRIKNLIKKCKDEKKERIRKELEEKKRINNERKLCEMYNCKSIEELEIFKENYVPPKQINIYGYKVNINIDIDPNNTRIEDIKAQISQQFEIPIELQNLYYKFISMENGKYLKDYLIPNNATISIGFNITDDRVFAGLKQQYVIPDEIFIKGLSGKYHLLHIDPNLIKIEDIMNQIQEIEGIPPDQQRLIYVGWTLLEGMTLRDYLISRDSTLWLNLRLRGGGGEQPNPKSLYAARTFVDGKNSDLIQIVVLQNVEGNWNEIPKLFLNDENNELNELIQKIINWRNQNDVSDLSNSIIATIFCLTFMTKYKKEKYDTWKIIYTKGIEWLKSINENLNWDELIKSF